MTTKATLRLVGEQTYKSGVQADWDRVGSSLNDHGNAVLEKLLTQTDCERLAACYGDDDGFRSRIVMSRHGFGRGEYKYFSYPLPEPIASLRTSLYPTLAAIANDWNARLGIEMRYPRAHADFLARCHKAGQSRPTPLLLQYGPRRLQLPAPGCLRRPRLSAASRHSSFGARARFHWRRIRHHRAAAAHAVARRGRAAPPG